MGLEPTTQWLTATCSTDWATSDHKNKRQYRQRVNQGRQKANADARLLPRVGFEPTHRTALGSKPSMSTNSITPAQTYHIWIHITSSHAWNNHSCGGWNRTTCLRVMSPARYHFSTPHLQQPQSSNKKKSDEDSREEGVEPTTAWFRVRCSTN